MAHLAIIATVQVPFVRGQTPAIRDRIIGARREIAFGLQQILNQARQQARTQGPRRTGKMLRGARVRRLRSPVPGGVSYELRLSIFYASFTNEINRSSLRWFNDLEAEVERAVYALANRVIKGLLSIYADLVFAQLIRVVARTPGRLVSARRTPGDFTNV